MDNLLSRIIAILLAFQILWTPLGHTQEWTGAVPPARDFETAIFQTHALGTYPLSCRFGRGGQDHRFPSFAQLGKRWRVSWQRPFVVEPIPAFATSNGEFAFGGFRLKWRMPLVMFTLDSDSRGVGRRLQDGPAKVVIDILQTQANGADSAALVPLWQKLVERGRFLMTGPFLTFGRFVSNGVRKQAAVKLRGVEEVWVQAFWKKPSEPHQGIFIKLFEKDKEKTWERDFNPTASIGFVERQSSDAQRADAVRILIWRIVQELWKGKTWTDLQEDAEELVSKGAFIMTGPKFFFGGESVKGRFVRSAAINIKKAKGPTRIEARWENPEDHAKGIYLHFQYGRGKKIQSWERRFDPAATVGFKERQAETKILDLAKRDRVMAVLQMIWDEKPESERVTAMTAVVGQGPFLMQGPTLHFGYGHRGRARKRGAIRLEKMRGPVTVSGYWEDPESPSKGIYLHIEEPSPGGRVWERRYDASADFGFGPRQSESEDEIDQKRSRITAYAQARWEQKSARDLIPLAKAAVEQGPLPMGKSPFLFGMFGPSGDKRPLLLQMDVAGAGLISCHWNTPGRLSDGIHVVVTEMATGRAWAKDFSPEAAMGFVAHRSKDEQQVDVMRGRILAHLKALVERRPPQHLVGEMTEMVDQGLFRMNGPALFFGEIPLAAKRLRALIHVTPFAGICEVAVQWLSPSAPWRGVFLAIHHLESGKRWEKLFAPETAGGFRDRTRSEGEDIAVDLHTYGIEEAVALLQHDLPRLHQYLQLYHPELLPRELSSIIKVAPFHGLHAGQIDPAERDRHMARADLTLQLEREPPRRSSSFSFRFSGTVRGQADHIQVTGDYTMTIPVDSQTGQFEGVIPLSLPGQLNHYSVYAVDSLSPLRGTALNFQIRQVSAAESTQEAFCRLIAAREDILTSIHADPWRHRYLLRSVELSLLKEFTYDEAGALANLARKSAQEGNPAMRTVYVAIYAKFKRIHESPNPYGLYFYQRYTNAEAQSMVEHGAKGVLIANDQGTGKTITALVFLHGRRSLIVTPNSVVSAWPAQQQKFMGDSDIEVIAGAAASREKLLRDTKRLLSVVNVEFFRSMTAKRQSLVERFTKRGVLLVDEGDVIGRPSRQSRALHRIQSALRILLTATPFGQIRHLRLVLHFLNPEDNRFRSDGAFAKAFPVHSADPNEVDAAMTALYLLLQDQMIRIRKEDVFDEYNPAIPLEDQPHRLPRQLPCETIDVELLDEQSESIRLLLTDYPAWCRRHRVGADDEPIQWKGQQFIPTLHALRQIMNDPAYIGVQKVSPKHQTMDREVRKILGDAKNPFRKVIIVCKYRSQVEAYLRLFSEFGAVGYYGGLARSRHGFKVDAQDNDRLEYFQVESGRYVLDPHGLPIRVPGKKDGKPILANDFSLLVFQFSPAHRVIIVLEEAARVGLTMTAGTDMIFDDLPATFRDYDQMVDRNHRPDDDRRKEVLHYHRLRSVIPLRFLNSLDPVTRETYFSLLYDDAQWINLMEQGKLFRGVMDLGIGMKDLSAIVRRTLKDRMPFLFMSGRLSEEENVDPAGQGGGELITARTAAWCAEHGVTHRYLQGWVAAFREFFWFVRPIRFLRDSGHDHRRAATGIGIMAASIAVVMVIAGQMFGVRSPEAFGQLLIAFSLANLMTHGLLDNARTYQSGRRASQIAA